jgi:hypothetical protein
MRVPFRRVKTRTLKNEGCGTRLARGRVKIRALCKTKIQWMRHDGAWLG